MKKIYIEAKQKLTNCMANDGDGAEARLQPSSSETASPTTSSSFAATTASTTATCSYDCSDRPFRYDKQRGRWSKSADFYFACISHAFGNFTFSEVPVYGLLFGGGVYFLPSYLIAILFYAIPIFAIQTFLGQFSSSGSISAFRVAPIFKGIGYTILLLNLTALTFYSIVAAVPLVYAVSSLKPVIPWMSCNNTWNSAECSNHTHYNEEDEYLYPHTTVEFFRAVIKTAHEGSSDYSMSWPMLFGSIGVWVVVLTALLNGVTFVGKFCRLACVLLVPIFLAIFVNLIIVKGIDWDHIWTLLKPDLVLSANARMSGIRTGVFMATFMLGPGWGSVLTLASYNYFHRDSEKQMYWVSVTHVVVAVMAVICGRIALDHFEDHVGMFHYHYEEEHYMQFVYLCLAYLFGSYTELPNFWCFLFFFMLFLAEVCSMIIQMLSVLSAIFDEFEAMRTKKTQFTIGLVAAMTLISAYFCTKQGFRHLHVLPNLAILTHMIVSLILLLMATWIYGRDHFQCDLQFMWGKTISTAKVFLIRFLTPVFVIVSMLQVIFLLNRDDPPSLVITQLIIFLVSVVYAIHKMCCTSGTLSQRLRQCFKPHDWHPVDAVNRRYYEEVMGTSEMLVIVQNDK